MIAGAALAGLLAFSPQETADAFRAGDCALCHTVPEVAAPTRLESCTDCHTWVRRVAADPAADARAREVFPLWDRYVANTASYLAVPSLEAARDRLDPAWVYAWLADPHDVRPGLPEGMPRLALTEAQRRAIVATFEPTAVPPTEPPSPARVAEGELLYTSRGCTACHAFGARVPAGDLNATAVRLAPDLALARHRMQPDLLAAWIEDPSSVSSHATMPRMGLSPSEALAVRDFLLLADPGASPAAPPAAVPALLDRPVAWEEVEERVFGRICVHCHMNPELNEGRAGPGNRGGFGWPATGIELQTWEGVVAAADRIPAALLRRRTEAARDTVGYGQRPADLHRPDRPGMPLGLPPLPDEDLALVLSWLAQGMPGPAAAQGATSLP